jgi:hypothetical protein
MAQSSPESFEPHNPGRFKESQGWLERTRLGACWYSGEVRIWYGERQKSGPATADCFSTDRTNDAMSPGASRKATLTLDAGPNLEQAIFTNRVFQRLLKLALPMKFLDIFTKKATFSEC